MTMKTSDDMDVASTEGEDGATITDKRMRGRPKRSPAGRTSESDDGLGVRSSEGTSSQISA